MNSFMTHISNLQMIILDKTLYTEISVSRQLVGFMLIFFNLYYRYIDCCMQYPQERKKPDRIFLVLHC